MFGFAGNVSSDLYQIYGRSTYSQASTTPSASFKGTFGCIFGANNLAPLANSPNLYSALYPYVSTCPPKVYLPAHDGVDAHCPSLASFSDSHGDLKTVVGESLTARHREPETDTQSLS